MNEASRGLFEADHPCDEPRSAIARRNDRRLKVRAVRAAVVAISLAGFALACASDTSKGVGTRDDWEGPPDADFAADRAACISKMGHTSGSYVGGRRRDIIECLERRGWRRKP
jgi:hypothetical protein